MISLYSLSSVNVGSIYNPNYHQLEEFYLKCKEVSNIEHFKFLIPNMNYRTFSKQNQRLESFISNKEDFKKSIIREIKSELSKEVEMKIYTSQCKVYQFIKRETSESCNV